MTKEEWIKKVSKIDQTFEDEFRAKYNSPELMWEHIISKLVCPQCALADVVVSEAELPSDEEIDSRFPSESREPSGWATIIDRDNHFKRLGAKWMKEQIERGN